MASVDEPVIRAAHPAVRCLPSAVTLADGACVIALGAACVAVAVSRRLVAGLHQPLRHGAARHTVALVHAYAALRDQTGTAVLSSDAVIGSILASMSGKGTLRCGAAAVRACTSAVRQWVWQVGCRQSARMERAFHFLADALPATRSNSLPDITRPSGSSISIRRRSSAARSPPHTTRTDGAGLRSSSCAATALLPPGSRCSARPSTAKVAAPAAAAFHVSRTPAGHCIQHQQVDRLTGHTRGIGCVSVLQSRHVSSTRSRHLPAAGAARRAGQQGPS